MSRLVFKNKDFFTSEVIVKAVSENYSCSVISLDPVRIDVHSISNKTYRVEQDIDKILTCTCPDYIYRRKNRTTFCKHIWHVLTKYNVPDRVIATIILKYPRIKEWFSVKKDTDILSAV